VDPMSVLMKPPRRRRHSHRRSWFERQVFSSSIYVAIKKHSWA
jgi:hypothetical protein